MNMPAKIISLVALRCRDHSMPAVLHRRDWPGRSEMDSSFRHDRLVHRDADMDEPQAARGFDRSRNLINR